MVFTSDIILNFLDGERIYEFFEWKKDDSLEHIKSIPLLKVDKTTLEEFVFNKVKVNETFLKAVENKTEIFTVGPIKEIKYAFLLTDNDRVIAFEFNDEGKRIATSSLLLDEEEEILDLVTNISATKIEYKVLKKEKDNLNTREEQFIKKYIIQEIKYAYKQKDYYKINYLYNEIYNSTNKNIEFKYKKLITEIKDNFNKKHFKLFAILKLTNVK